MATGTTATTNVNVINQGSAAVNVSEISVSGQAFSVSGTGNLPVTVPAGGTYSIGVNFVPTGIGAAAGQLMISSDAATDGTLMVGLSGMGTGTTGSASPSPILTSLSCAFNGATGTAVDNCTVALNSAALNGGFAVGLSSNNPAVTVPNSVTVQAGATTASFTALISSVSSAQTATLAASADGVAETFLLRLGVQAIALGVSSASVAFGDVPLNTPATQSLVLASSGGAAVSVSSVIVTGSGFSVPGISFPLILNPNQQVTLNVQFDPTAAGAAAGTLTIVSTSLTTPITSISLSGTGVVDLSYEVELTWEAPPDSPDPVAGYYVYRSPSGASQYEQLNSTAITQTSYVDANVQDGQTFDYFVVSVDASGVESGPSSVASVPIP